MTIVKKVLTATFLPLVIFLGGCSLKNISEKIDTLLTPDIETREFLSLYNEHLAKEDNLRSNDSRNYHAISLLERMHSPYSPRTLTQIEKDILEDYLTDISEDAAKEAGKERYLTSDMKNLGEKFKFEIPKRERKPGVSNLYGLTDNTKFGVRSTKAYARKRDVEILWTKFSEARMEIGLKGYKAELVKPIKKNWTQRIGFNNDGPYYLLAFQKRF